MLGLFAVAAVPTVSASPQLNNVQVMVTTTSSIPYSFYFAAYNLTGSLIATYQSPYPGAGFELPSGSYLFTVSAVSQQPYYCEMCPVPLMKGSTANGSSGSSPSMPVMYRMPASEYGYAVEQVSGPVTLAVTTKNASDYPTVPVVVRVTYANGTAAANSSVSAAVVGGWYYWWGSNSSAVMWGQTDASGKVTLVLPQAPAVVTAWKWVAVNVSADGQSEPVTVGGQKMNVTSTWETTYVGLAGSALWLPPASEVRLSLRSQQFGYWYWPTGMTPPAGTGSGAAVSSGQAGVPADTRATSGQQYYLPSSIPAMGAYAGGSSSSGLSPESILAIEVIGVVAAVVVAGAVVLMRRKATGQGV